MNQLYLVTMPYGCHTVILLNKTDLNSLLTQCYYVLLKDLPEAGVSLG